MRRIVASRILAVFGIAWLSLAGTGWAQGFVVIAGDDADEAAGGHCRDARCGSLFKNLFIKAFQYSNIKNNRILAIGVNSSEALSAFNGWNVLGPVGVVTHARTTTEIATAVFSDYQLVYIPSWGPDQTAGGITTAQIAELNLRQPDLAHYVNKLGGALIALTQAGAPGGWGWLPVPLIALNQTFGSVDITPALQALSPTTTTTNMDHDFFHNVFTGPPGFSGLGVLAVRTGTSNPVYLGGPGTILRSEICNDGLDNDGDELVDEDDPDCHVCGDGDVDPNETCDDGNKISGDGCSEVCQTENQPPVAHCMDVLVSAGPSCLAGASVDAGSSDPEGDAVTVAQFSPGPYGPGTTPVLLTVTDTDGALATCSALVTVVDETPPTLACPAPVVVECAGPEGASASFQVSANDNCACGGVASRCDPQPGSTFSLGSTPISCSAVDASGNTTACDSSVTVVDTSAPSVDLVTASPAVLWPPNHSMVGVTVAVSISDVCDPNVGSSCAIVMVESNEPDNDLGDGNTDVDWQIDLGDGNTHNDWQVTGPLTVDLRAERAGNRTGRVYTITAECKDASGNLATRSVQVSVPHNQ